MEPNHETPPEMHTPGGPEKFSPGFNSPEQQEGLPPTPTPEQAPNQHETHERASGAGAGDNPQLQAAPSPVAPPAPPSVDDGASATAKKHPANDNPLVADDVDVIEKEWVDRTKKILQETKDDPYQKEHEISHLQADYLEKRFGVQVKLPQG